MQIIMKAIGHSIVGVVLLVIVIIELATRGSQETTFAKNLASKGYSKIELSKPIVKMLLTPACGRFQRYTFKAQKDGKKASGIICETMTGIHVELDKK